MSDNPPAFPRTGEGFGNPMYDTPGMYLRDWYSGQALVGLLASGTFSNSGGGFEDFIAQKATNIADAMLAARATLKEPANG